MRVTCVPSLSDCHGSLAGVERVVRPAESARHSLAVLFTARIQPQHMLK